MHELGKLFGVSKATAANVVLNVTPKLLPSVLAQGIETANQSNGVEFEHIQIVFT